MNSSAVVVVVVIIIIITVTRSRRFVLKESKERERKRDLISKNKTLNNIPAIQFALVGQARTGSCRARRGVTVVFGASIAIRRRRRRRRRDAVSFSKNNIFWFW